MGCNKTGSYVDPLLPSDKKQGSSDSQDAITASKNGPSTSSPITTTSNGTSSGDVKQEPCFRFLQLPAELRVMIYKDIVRQTSPKLYMSSQLSDHDLGQRTIWLQLSSKFEPAILRLSTEVYNEALPVIYENIPMVVQLEVEQPNLAVFLEGLTKTPFRFIRHLEWSVCGSRLSSYKPFTTTTAFDRMPNLNGPQGMVVIRLDTTFTGEFANVVANVSSLATMAKKHAQVWIEGYTGGFSRGVVSELRERGLVVKDLTVARPPAASNVIFFCSCDTSRQQE